MRIPEEFPINALEHAIEDMLVKAGINANDIEFNTSIGKDQSRYIRIGYWMERIDIDVPGLKELVTEEIIWDDDCGDLFFYSIKK